MRKQTKINDIYRGDAEDNPLSFCPVPQFKTTLFEKNKYMYSELYFKNISCYLTDCKLICLGLLSVLGKRVICNINLSYLLHSTYLAKFKAPTIVPSLIINFGMLGEGC